MRLNFTILVMSMLVMTFAKVPEGEVSGNDCSSVVSVCESKGLSSHALKECISDGMNNCCNELLHAPY